MSTNSFQSNSIQLLKCAQYGTAPHTNTFSLHITTIKQNHSYQTKFDTSNKNHHHQTNRSHHSSHTLCGCPRPRRRPSTRAVCVLCGTAPHRCERGGGVLRGRGVPARGAHAAAQRGTVGGHTHGVLRGGEPLRLPSSSIMMVLFYFALLLLMIVQ